MVLGPPLTAGALTKRSVCMVPELLNRLRGPLEKLLVQFLVGHRTTHRQGMRSTKSSVNLLGLFRAAYDPFRAERARKTAGQGLAEAQHHRPDPLPAAYDLFHTERRMKTAGRRGKGPCSQGGKGPAAIRKGPGWPGPSLNPQESMECKALFLF